MLSRRVYWATLDMFGISVEFLYDTRDFGKSLMLRPFLEK